MNKFVKFLSNNKQLLKDYIEKFDNKVVDIYEYKNDLYVMFIQSASKQDVNQILKMVSKNFNPFGNLVRTAKINAESLECNYLNFKMHNSAEMAVSKYVSFMYKTCPGYKKYLFDKYSLKAPQFVKECENEF